MECREKARELQLFCTRQLGCNYWALEYQGHGDSTQNFEECTLTTWCEAVFHPAWLRASAGAVAVAWLLGSPAACTLLCRVALLLCAGLPAAATARPQL